MRTIEDYLALITSEHRLRQRFVDTVSMSVAPAVRVQEVLSGFLSDFDLDDAVGKQLDTIGIWVGVSRFLDTPLPNVYFSWDDTAAVGWEGGTWKGPFDPLTGLTSLPDDEYRLLIKAKIAANSWDGSIPGAYEVWTTVFADLVVLIQDNQNMTMTVGMVGDEISTITKALITGGYIPLKPEGVGVDYYVTSSEGDPLFVWDAESSALAGWDSGSWGEILLPT